MKAIMSKHASAKVVPSLTARLLHFPQLSGDARHHQKVNQTMRNKIRNNRAKKEWP